MSVTMGASHTPSASRSRTTASATTFCSSEWWKITDRYCVPTSPPWRLSVVGSWIAKKISRTSR